MVIKNISDDRQTAALAPGVSYGYRFNRHSLFLFFLSKKKKMYLFIYLFIFSYFLALSVHILCRDWISSCSNSLRFFYFFDGLVDTCVWTVIAQCAHLAPRDVSTEQQKAVGEKRAAIIHFNRSLYAMGWA